MAYIGKETLQYEYIIWMLKDLYPHRVTMPPVGKNFQKQFRKSGSVTLEKLADLMYNGPSIMEGLQQASERR